MKDPVAEIEKAVLATPGVVALYRTGSVVTNLIGAAAERIGGSEDAAARVVVTEADGTTRVEIAIGIESVASAVEIAQTVRERVAALFVERGEETPFIRLAVVHVMDGRSLV